MTDNSEATSIVIFDWGDTLMRVFPQYSGPMAGWPQVQVVPGVEKALETLHGHYRLFVATNATESTATLVRQALDRVNLGKYFEAIYTSHEIGGVRKPNPTFFDRIAALLNVQPSQLTIIGDSFRSDILSAARAGVRTIWYNPDCLPAPGLLPVHDADLNDLSMLPELLKKMTLPGWQECFLWMEEQGASQTLLNHVQIVAAAAYQIALWLRSSGVTVDPILTHRGGMLHDLMKLSSLKSLQARGDHGEQAFEVLTQRGQPELAEIARRHLLFCLLDEKARPRTWEQKLVYFADKLVENSHVADLDTRLQGLRLRYPQDSDRIQACAPAVYALQDEICSLLHYTPEVLNKYLQAALRGE